MLLTHTHAECLRLSPDKPVHSCVLHEGSVVVYCEGVAGEEEHGCQVSSRTFEHSELLFEVLHLERA